MKILIPGGAGHLGRILSEHYAESGHEVVVLSRQQAGTVKTRIGAGWRMVNWTGETPGPWARELENTDVIINLAGRSVNCRYTPANREAILQSRIRSTRVIAEAVRACASPPKLWLQSSTATIYAHRFDAPNDEETGIIGGSEPDVPETWRFSIDVATAWEKTFDEASLPASTRKVKMRTAIVMSPEPGGAFEILLRLVRFGLAGKAGSGRQYVSWITDDDFVRALNFLIAREDITGAVNLSSPNPLPNSEFMSELRDACGIAFGLPASEWMLEAGAIALQTETELILKSRRVVPAKLLAAGFQFHYPDWPIAARHLYERRQALR